MEEHLRCSGEMSMYISKMSMDIIFMSLDIISCPCTFWKCTWTFCKCPWTFFHVHGHKKKSYLCAPAKTAFLCGLRILIVSSPNCNLIVAERASQVSFAGLYERSVTTNFNTKPLETQIATCACRMCRVRFEIFPSGLYLYLSNHKPVLNDSL
jgi:hypothetical protein